MIIPPSTRAAFVDKLGQILDPWWTYLTQFAQSPAPILPIPIGPSPFAYQVKEPGCMHITGGIIGSITFTRGSDTITVLTSNYLLPVCIGDIITITYSVLPTMKFLPNYSSRRNA